MPNGWTGGQYAVFRVLLAAAVASQLGAIGWILALPLALGFADALVAAVLVGVICIAALFGHSLGFARGAVASALLLLHAATPGSPYGSWSARRRADPGAGWTLPAWLLRTAQALFVACLALAAGGGIDSLGVLWLPLALLALDPAWIAPKRDGVPASLFYDGTCGLCHAAVRFLLSEDRDGRGFRFAPLASESFARLLPAERRASLPDSLVLVEPDRTLHVRSSALRESGARLGGLWRSFAFAAALVPEPWLDALYDAIARRRKSLIAAPDAACPLVSAELRARFD